jgi:hypothetical protein
MSSEPKAPVIAAPVPASRKRVYTPTGRPRGRPPGSRNKSKAPEAQITPALRPVALRVPNAARYADVSVSLMRKWNRQGLVESVTVGGIKLILVASIDRLLGVGQ